MRARRAPAAEPRNHGAGEWAAGAVDFDSRHAVGPIRTIRGVYMTQLNRLQRLAALSAPKEEPLRNPPFGFGS
jgi:hypothetical protein